MTMLGTMLPAPGSPTFVPALLAYLQEEINSAGETWSIDPSLFSTLLLSQVVGPERGGVIVDVVKDESGKRGLGRVVDSVVALTQGVFGLSTQTLHCGSTTHPSEVPYALFLNPDPSWPNPTRTGRSSSSMYTHGGPSRSRSRSIGIGNYSRTNTASSPTASRYTSALPSPFFPRSTRNSRTTTPGVTPGITPKNSTPLLNSEQAFSSAGFGPPLIPPANASGAASRKPSEVHEKYGYGTRDGYNNGTGDEGTEWLDDNGEGSMPTEPEPSLPKCLVISGLERSGSPVWMKLVDILLKGYVELDIRISPNEIAAQDGELPGGMAGSAEQYSTPAVTDVRPGRRRRDLPDDLWVIWVRAEDKSEQCPSWLVDRFACSVSVYPADLEIAPMLPIRSLLPSSVGILTQRLAVQHTSSPPLNQADFDQYIQNLHALLPFTHIHPPLITHSSNLLSALSSHPRLSSTITGKTMLLFPEFIRAHRLLSAPFDLPAGWESGLARRTAILSASQRKGVGHGTTSGGQTGQPGGVVSGGKGGKMGVGGGLGGVDTWDVISGEEPNLDSLMAGRRNTPVSQSDSIGIQQHGEGEDGRGISEWYCNLSNVEAVVRLALRHRLKWRDERDEVMWLLKGSARSHLAAFERGPGSGQAGVNGEQGNTVLLPGQGGTSMSHDVDEGMRRKKEQNKQRRNRRQVDMILEKVMETV